MLQEDRTGNLHERCDIFATVVIRTRKSVKKMAELKTVPVIGRVATRIENYLYERKKRGYVDLAHKHRCYQAGELAEKEYDQLKDRALIESRSIFYR